MIDLLKNYKELRTAPGYVSSIQYYLAKKKLDVIRVSLRPSLWSGLVATKKWWKNL